MSSENRLEKLYQRILVICAATALAAVLILALTQFWLLSSFVVETALTRSALLYLPVIAVGLVFLPVLIWLMRTARQEITQIQQRLEQTERTHRLYIKQSEHELQRPLTVARANVELLYDNPTFLTKEITQRKLQTTLRVIDRLSAMIKSFRYLHTFDLESELKLNIRSTDFYPLVASIVDEYAFTSPGNIEIALEQSHKAARRVELDSEAIEQVLINILDFRLAAIERERMKQASISVRTIDSGSFIMIIITDDGPKLIVDNLMDSEMALAHPGLIASRAILDAHLGTLSFVNRKAQGCRFVIAVPLASEQLSPLRVEPLRKVFSLGKMVSESVDEYQSKAQARGIKLESVLIDGLGYGYEGDENSIREALANLIDNAIKYCRSGDQISVQVQDKTEDVIVRVLDSGPGIPADQLPRIFNTNYQIDNSREGQGLGLSIVKAIVEGHGGTLAVENRPNGGTVFTIRLRRFSTILPSSPVDS